MRACCRERASVDRPPRGFFAHAASLVETDQVGAGTRIWAFCHVLAGAVIGRGCNLGDHCFVEGGVVIGDDVVIKNGVSIWHGVTIENGVFVGPNVAFANDLVPRAKVYLPTYDRTLLCEGASIGANATLLCGITIGRFALVGAGAVVTSDVPDHGLVVGNPARLRGSVCRCGQRLAFSAQQARCACGRAYRQADGRVEEIG
jgi:UDP-2-acetamido-3-amino-2,3-dideoxy-glucuronate N-acetyltransferase